MKGTVTTPLGRRVTNKKQQKTKQNKNKNKKQNKTKQSNKETKLNKNKQQQQQQQTSVDEVQNKTCMKKCNVYAMLTPAGGTIHLT